MSERKALNGDGHTKPKSVAQKMDPGRTKFKKKNNPQWSNKIKKKTPQNKLLTENGLLGLRLDKHKKDFIAHLSLSTRPLEDPEGESPSRYFLIDFKCRVQKGGFFSSRLNLHKLPL